MRSSTFTRLSLAIFLTTCGAAHAELAPIAVTEAGRISVERHGLFTMTTEVKPARSDFECGHSADRQLIVSAQETGDQRHMHCSDEVSRSPAHRAE